MNVLIIDDDPEDTLLFRDALSELSPNATCIVAHTCENIEVWMEKVGQVDIIFLDAHMHPVDGKECLERLIKLVDRSRTKIVVNSGRLSPKERADLEMTEPDYIFIKASSYDMLKSHINEVLATI